MSNVVIASNPQDAHAAERVVGHHAEMLGTLRLLVEHVLAAASAPRGATDLVPSRTHLVDWCRSELLPHAAAEEETLYAAARRLDSTRVLVAAMTDEHAVITGLVDELESTSTPVEIAAAAGALRAVFETHLAKENERLLPELVASPEHSVAEMLEGMHEILGADEADHAGHEAMHHGSSVAAAGSGCGGHTCGCGEAMTTALPELDARAVPHAIRHATIFGALDAVPVGGAMVLVAPHDPVPLLMQLEERAPSSFQVSYIEQGPSTWRLQFTRRG